MSDKTSQSGTSNDLLHREGSGIYAPARLAHPIPRQRYGWRATIIVLAHALLLGVFLMRFDFLSDGPAPSRPETLDIIVVDLSGHKDTTPPAEPVAEPTLTSSPQPDPLALASASQPIHEVPTIPVESTTQPVVETLPPTKEASTTATTESSARSEAPSPESTPTSKAEPTVTPAPVTPAPAPPTPAPKTAAAAVSKNTPATSSSATKGEPQQPAVTQNRDTESQTTPPRLDPAYLHNPAPNYPALSKRNRESGTVLLLVKVDPDGSATAVTLHQSSGYDRLDQAAIQAVTRWRFVPGMRGQTAISATVIVPISFKQQ
jgi:protein TonB